MSYFIRSRWARNNILRREKLFQLTSTPVSLEFSSCKIYVEIKWSCLKTKKDLLLVFHVSTLRFVLRKSQVFGNLSFNMVSYGVKHVHKGYKRGGGLLGGGQKLQNVRVPTLWMIPRINLMCFGHYMDFFCVTPLFL